MKSLQIVPRDGSRLYAAMIRKQAEIRRGGRGTFSRAGARRRNAARWTHVRYKGSVELAPGAQHAVNVEIKSPERGDEARLLSSFLGRSPFRRTFVIGQYSISGLVRPPRPRPAIGVCPPPWRAAQRRRGHADCGII